MADDATPSVIETPVTAEAIAHRLRHRLSQRLPASQPDPLREALIHVGARYGEILVEHVNAAPERLRRAFDAMLGGVSTPALPAEVLLSFQPVAARPMSASGVVVPAHTMVAAPPAADERDAVVYETLEDLDALRLQPACSLAVDPQRALVADAAALWSAEGATSDLLAAATPSELALNIALPTSLVAGPLSQLRVEADVLDAGVRGPRASISWGVLTPQGFVPMTVESDSTQHLTRSGTVVLTPPETWPLLAQQGLLAPWLAGRLVLADGPSSEGPAFAPPRLSALRLAASARALDVAPDAVFFGNLALDASKDYFPFGERPRFGDVFLLSAPLLARPGAHVTLTIRLTNPATLDDGPLPSVRRDGQPRVTWQIFTRRGWVAFAAVDTTDSLTQDGSVAFVVPEDVAPQTVAGRAGAWVRALLASGHYGMRKVDHVTTLFAPSISSLTVSGHVEIGTLPPAGLLRVGPLDAVTIDPAATPIFPAFAPLDTSGPALYLGLASREAGLRGRKLAILVEPLPAPGKPVLGDGDDTQAEAPSPRWQLLCEGGWRDCEVEDGSAWLTRVGVVGLRLPAEAAPWQGCRFEGSPSQPPLAWIRAAWPPAQRGLRLRRLALNSVRARQTIKLDNELLGSSNGRPGQVFTALRTPVFGEPVLQVREDPAGDYAGPWVRWHRVTDFALSETNARHFTLDAASGRITFGDGKHGRIPPPGPNNVRLHEYHAGGGRRGNRPSGSVVQLRTAVPYIEGVANRVPASGGQDAADAAASGAGGGAWLRHRGRAVCAADYEDLARAASRDVARAYCRGGSASIDPAEAGKVTLVIVPDSQEPQPQPGRELLAAVKTFLDQRRPPWALLTISGADYAMVAVTAQLRCAAEASPSATSVACRQRLQAFLHPLSGNSDGRGWSPGQRPHHSDLVALLGEVEGVEDVESLSLRIDEPSGGSAALALVSAGALEVSA